jgi:hypothetical protein
VSMYAASKVSFFRLMLALWKRRVAIIKSIWRQRSAHKHPFAAPVGSFSLPSASRRRLRPHSVPRRNTSSITRAEQQSTAIAAIVATKYFLH